MVYFVICFIVYVIVCNVLVIRETSKTAKKKETTFYQVWCNSNARILSTIMYPIAAIVAQITK